MKKLGLLVLFFLSIVLLAGCQEAEPTADTFLVEVRDFSGTVLLSQEVEYPENTELGLVELIDEVIDLDYELSQWGAFIKGVGGHYPKEYGLTYNYYWGLYVNDEMSLTGLDQITYEEDMVISLREQTMLSTLDLEIDAWIEHFIHTHTNDYINETVMSQYVLAALKQLDAYGYDTPDLSSLTYPTFNGTDVSSVFKNALVMKSTNQTITETMLTDFLALTPANPYEAVTYLNAFDLLFQTTAHDKRNAVIAQLKLEQPTFMDADYAAMAIQAVSSVKDSEDGLLVINAMTTYINDYLSKDGVVSWGNANASSTAAVILGLLSIGIDPRSEAYTVEGVDLIESLMQYQGQSGFKYLLADTNDDLAFSTPQAFAALVAYKIVRDQLHWSTKQLNLWLIS